MLQRKIRPLALTGITIAGAALVTLSTTAASAATTTASAPGHATAATASAATACVFQDFSISDENTFEPCVRDAQVLLNDLYNIGIPGPNQRLTVDGHYGPATRSDVTSFQANSTLQVDGILGPQTWQHLCFIDHGDGFTGVYYNDAGCPDVV